MLWCGLLFKLSDNSGAMECYGTVWEMRMVLSSYSCDHCVPCSVVSHGAI